MKSLGLILIVLFSSLSLGRVPSVEPETTLPCDMTGLAVASDGSGLWFACSREWAIKRREIAEGKFNPPYVGTQSDPTEIYWLASGSSAAVKVASAKEVIQVIPAPQGARALLVMPQEHSWGTAVLYEKDKKLEVLPVDAYLLEWSADARRLYFYGGSTIQADAWNILGIYEFDSGRVRRQRLHEPTEIIRVCKANGNVYSATPAFAKSKASTVEYDSKIGYIRDVHAWDGARFSAKCTYVASEADYHGPLPWKIYETATGRVLFSFDAEGEDENKPSYSLLEWNPTHDSLMLREHTLGNQASVLEVFDVKAEKVLLQLSGADDVVTWAADGDSVLIGNGKSLLRYQIPPVKSD
jgi:hypothetical protein